MAKKKAKKKSKKTRKVKKVAKKKTKVKIVRETIRDKIARIRARVPCIEPTGECKDEITKEVLFRFTEAQHVFKTYRLECEMEGLIWRPYCAVGIQPVVVAFGRGIYTLIPFCIEDIKTGEIVVGWGSGGGNNADWSGNTAHTRALKQFLLTTFQATWEDPEQLTYTEQKEQLKQEVVKELEANGTLAKIEQLNFWARNLGKKGKEDDTKRKDTEDSRRTDSKKNRTGKKRDNRRSK